MTTREIVAKERVQERLASMVEEGRGRAAETIQRLAADPVKDRIVKVGRNGSSTPIEVVLTPSGEVGLQFDEAADPYSFHNHALRQFGEKLDLLGRGGNLRGWIEGEPWQKEVVADVMATTLAKTDRRERMLMRSVDQQIRGVLSDQYRRLSSADIIHAFLEAATQTQMVPYRAHYDEIKWSMEMVLPTMLDLATPEGLDYIGLTMKLRSSDFGAASQELTFGVVRLACINGMLSEKMLREVHLGMKLPDEITIAEDTFRADTQRSAGLIRDSVRGVLTQQSLQKRLLPLQQAAAQEIDAPKEIEGLVKARRITRQEADRVEEVLMRGNPMEAPTGSPTKWRLANALSLLSNASEVSEERSHELQILSGWLCGLRKDVARA